MIGRATLARDALSDSPVVAAAKSLMRDRFVRNYGVVES